jgi:hypothetical protein
MGSPATRIQGEDANGVVQEQGFVGDSPKVHSGFIPSSYDPDLTMDGTAQSGALATGATKVQFCNLGATTEAIRVAFGSTALIAEANLTIAAAAATTGYYIPALADAGSGACVTLTVPSVATHYAVANAVATDVQVVTVNQGV